MCNACPKEWPDYQRAYRHSQSVSVELSTFCPKCSSGVLVKKEDIVHLSRVDGEIGELWEPLLRCPKCEWCIIVKVIPKLNKAGDA